MSKKERSLATQSVSLDGEGRVVGAKKLSPQPTTNASLQRSDALGRWSFDARDDEGERASSGGILAAASKSVLVVKSQVQKRVSKTNKELERVAKMMADAKRDAALAAAHAAEAAMKKKRTSLAQLGRRYLKFRHRVPRFLLFPSIMLVFMALCCSWVLPITFYSMDLSQNTVTIDECYMLYGKLPPYNVGTQNTSANNLVVNASRGCFIGGVEAEATLPNFRQALVENEDAIVGNITDGRAEAEAFWNYDLPDLFYTGCAATLKPRGKINPNDGLMNLVLSWKTSTAYPRNGGPDPRNGGGNPQAIQRHQVPVSNGTRINNVTGVVERNAFVITWNIQCNQESATCASDEACGVILIDCGTDLVSEPGRALAMYPFDRYYFAADISVTADVVSIITGESIRIGVPMVFTFSQSTNAYYIDQHFNDGELAASGFEQLQAVFFFPPLEAFGTSNSLAIRNIFKLRRTKIVVAWSMFVVVMMWLLSVGMLLSVLDFYWRPHDMYNGMQFSAIGLLWTLIFMRGTQPDVPPIGIVIDVAGFLWNWLFVAMSSLICMGYSYEQYKHGDKHREMEKEKAEKLARRARAEAEEAAAREKEEQARAAGMAALHHLVTVQEEREEEERKQRSESDVESMRSGQVSNSGGMRKAQSAANLASMYGMQSALMPSAKQFQLKPPAIPVPVHAFSTATAQQQVQHLAHAHANHHHAVQHMPTLAEVSPDRSRARGAGVGLEGVGGWGEGGAAGGGVPFRRKSIELGSAATAATAAVGSTVAAAKQALLRAQQAMKQPPRTGGGGGAGAGAAAESMASAAPPGHLRVHSGPSKIGSGVGQSPAASAAAAATLPPVHETPYAAAVAAAAAAAAPMPAYRQPQAPPPAPAAAAVPMPAPTADLERQPLMRPEHAADIDVERGWSNSCDLSYGVHLPPSQTTTPLTVAALAAHATATAAMPLPGSARLDDSPRQR
ncbi:hypothetical protein FOA52_004189 [Chlamydomonas sp. UWO 241]|nr:hypothetical protein FOA52_004189 [Chlamydomonas sp. UWO 241]